jgi:hypothetical protein
MRAYKWVLTMWSCILGIIVATNLSITINFAIHNPQMMSLMVSTPLMIWLVWWMKGLMGHNGKDPKKWWKGDNEWKN